MRPIASAATRPVVAPLVASHRPHRTSRTGNIQVSRAFHDSGKNSGNISGKNGNGKDTPGHHNYTVQGRKNSTFDRSHVYYRTQITGKNGKLPATRSATLPSHLHTTSAAHPATASATTPAMLPATPASAHKEARACQAALFPASQHCRIAQNQNSGKNGKDPAMLSAMKIKKSATAPATRPATHLATGLSPGWPTHPPV